MDSNACMPWPAVLGYLSISSRACTYALFDLPTYVLCCRRRFPNYFAQYQTFPISVTIGTVVSCSVWALLAAGDFTRFSLKRLKSRTLEGGILWAYLIITESAGGSHTL